MQDLAQRQAQSFWPGMVLLAKSILVWVVCLETASPMHIRDLEFVWGKDFSNVFLINKQLHWLKYDGIHTALYPKWHPRPFQVKPESLIFSPRDQWFFDLPDNDIAKQTWRQGLEYRWNNTPDFLKADVARVDLGFKVLTSRPYDIGP